MLIRRCRSWTRAASVVVVSCVSVAGATAQGPTPTQRDFREIVRHATDAVFPAVVFIKCVREGLETGERQSFEVTGSGVVISALESGSKAAVGGVRPFELITAVDGEPVYSIDGFERALEQSGQQIRLQVSRMGRGRAVNITLNE